MSFLKQIWTIVLYEQNLNLNDEISITGDEFYYITTVLRLNSDDIVEIVNGMGVKARAIIYKIHKKSCDIRVIELMFIEQKKRFIHLCLAQLKPSALEDGVFVASELGIDFIHLFPTEKSMSKQPIKLEKLQKLSNEAMRISKSAYSAKIIQYQNLDNCLVTLQQKLTTPCFLFCDETAKNPIVKFIPDSTIENICLLIGPEGSFSIQERSIILNLVNCSAVSLGSHILRAQTSIACAGFVACNLR